jgi:hypothetical protein
LRIWQRLQLFQAGLIAGCIQAAIVIVVTPLAILFAQYRDNDASASGRDPASSVITLLPLIYVVFAAGVALTKHRYVTLTTTKIRHASRLMSSSEPERAAGTIAVCLLFASIGCASFALQPPPAFLVAMNRHLGSYAAAPILWSALISVAVAERAHPLEVCEHPSMQQRAIASDLEGDHACRAFPRPALRARFRARL